MTFKTPMEGPTCLRCGHDKKLDPLFEFVYSRPYATDFYVCRNRQKCLTRRQQGARLSTVPKPKPTPGVSRGRP